MPPKRYIPIAPAPAKFHYQQGWLGGWLVMEGDKVVANCLNICVALFAHLPIKLAGVKTDAAS